MIRKQRELLGWFSLVTSPAWVFPLGGILSFSASQWVGLFGLYLMYLETGVVGCGVLWAVGVFLSSPILLFFKRYRRYAGLSLALAVIFVFCYALGLGLDLALRWEQLEQIPDRGQPLVDEIRAYEKKNGHPPGSLDELVPEYLAVIPETGIGVWPQFFYRTGDPNSCEGNEWILMVDLPCVMGFDHLKYLPRQNYPEGSALVGNWIYRRQG
jgi:hypothetical protein